MILLVGLKTGRGKRKRARETNNNKPYPDSSSSATLHGFQPDINGFGDGSLRTPALNDEDEENDGSEEGIE